MRKCAPAVAALATGLITGSGLSLTVLPAHAAGSEGPAAHPTHSAHTRTLSADRISQVRDRQRQMIAERTPAPAFAKATATTFTVDTTDDADLADPSGTTCVDTGGHCSLRAAVNAANNLRKPVTIVLRKRTYTLSSGTQLTVTNAAGTSIVGKGRGLTAIAGTGASRVIEESQADFALATPLLFLTDLTVTGGNAQFGGGIHLDDQNRGATLVLDGVTFSGNTAEQGGGLESEGHGTIYATDTRFNHNVAKSGAGLYTNWATVSFKNVTVAGNSSPGDDSTYGGGWNTYYSVIRMRGGSISGNTAGTATDLGEGGGLWDYAGNIALTDVDVQDNVAADGGQGGGIWAEYDLVEINGGSISHNRATGDSAVGGGLYVYVGAQVGLHDVRMTGNKVDGPSEPGYGGGAVHVFADGYGTQVTIDSGTTIRRSNAGAVYVHGWAGMADLSLDHVVLSDNVNGSANGADGQGCGGAICTFTDFAGSANLSLSHDRFVDNASTAGVNGSGAIGATAASDGGGNRIHVTGSLFRGNSSSGHGLGGAIGVATTIGGQAASLRSASNTFDHNSAGAGGDHGWGGAIGIVGFAALADSGSTFTHNRSLGDDAYGGAVYTNSQQSSRFTRTTFTDNSSGPRSGGGGHGGAVYANDEGGTTFDRVTMTHNRTATYGGGIDTSSHGYEVSVERSTIAHNTAGNTGTSGYGGGIYAFYAVLNVENSTVTGNRSVQGSDQFDATAGGIYSEGSTFGLRYSTVTGNVAAQGAGVYLNVDAATTLGSILADNRRADGRERDCGANDPDPVMHSLGGNVLGQRGCVTAVQKTDRVTRKLHLGHLADNGGPTTTMALSAKSPAVGIATFQCPVSDQRGHDRPSSRCDAGAYELPQVNKH